MPEKYTIDDGGYYTDYSFLPQSLYYSKIPDLSTRYTTGGWAHGKMSGDGTGNTAIVRSMSQLLSSTPAWQANQSADGVIVENEGNQYYKVVSGDTISVVEKRFGRTREEIYAMNPDLQRRTSADGKTIYIYVGEHIKVGEANSVTFVSSYEYASISAMYGLDADDTSGLGVVPTEVYEDWKLSKRVSAFNFFGQDAIKELTTFSLTAGTKGTALDISRAFESLGLTSGMQPATLPSLSMFTLTNYTGPGSNLQYPLGNSYSAYNPRNYDKAFEAYNAALVTDTPPNYFDSIVAGANTLLTGTSFDIAGTSVSIRPVTNSGTINSIGVSMGVPTSWGCPIGIDLGNDSQALARDALSLKSMFSSTAFFDMDGDGYRERTAWVGPEDGLLVIDLDGDGVIDQAKEVSFKLWSAEAKAA